MKDLSKFHEEYLKYMSPMYEGEKQGVMIAAPVFKNNKGRVARYGTNEAIIFSSNNYLGLADHPEVIETMKKALDKYGASMCGSRMHNGTTDMHRELEQKLSKALGTEDAVLFSSGYLANVGAAQGVSCDSDMVFITDAYNHASINDGIQVSGGKKKIYTHNDMDKLEYILKKNQNVMKKMIMVDGIFSMSSEKADLVKIVELAEKYNAMVMVDEAHSFGILGKHGYGLCEEAGVSEKVDMKMVTFSKSLGGVGGGVAAPKLLCDYMRYVANAYLFTVTMNPASVAGVLKSFELIEREPWRIKKVWDNTKYFVENARNMGFDIDKCESPIVPITVGDNIKTIKFSDAVLKKGVYVCNAVYPVVPKDKSILRITMSAALEKEDIDKGLEIMKVTAKEFGIL